MATCQMEASTEASSEVPYKRHAGAHGMRQLVSAMLLLSALAVCALLASGGNFSVSRTNDLAQEDWRLRAVKNEARARRGVREQLLQYPQQATYAQPPQYEAPQQRYQQYAQQQPYQQYSQQPYPYQYAQHPSQPAYTQQPQQALAQAPRTTTASKMVLSAVPPPGQAQAQQSFLKSAGSYFAQAAGASSEASSSQHVMFSPQQQQAQMLQAVAQQAPQVGVSSSSQRATSPPEQQQLGIQQLGALAPQYPQQLQQQQQYTQQLQQAPAYRQQMMPYYQQRQPAVAAATLQYQQQPQYAQQQQQQYAQQQQQQPAQYQQQQLAEHAYAAYAQRAPPQQFVGTMQQQHAIMMEQQIPGTPLAAPQQLQAILPKASAASSSSYAFSSPSSSSAPLFKSENTIRKLSQGDDPTATLFRLFSSSVSTDSATQSAQTAGDKRAQLTAANGAISSDSDKDSVASQGSPRSDGDNQDALFKLFTAPQSAFDAPAKASAAAALQGPLEEDQQQQQKEAVGDLQQGASLTSSADDTAGLPQSRQDLAAINDLAHLSTNSNPTSANSAAAGEQQLSAGESAGGLPDADPSASSDPSAADSAASSDPSAADSAGPAASSSASSAIALKAEGAHAMTAPRAADQGLFALWQNAGKGDSATPLADAADIDTGGSLDAADGQDGVSLAAGPPAPPAPTDYYGIPNGGAAVPV